MYSRQNLRNRNKEDLTESTGVVPTKYPLKVKLERISTILECQSWKNYLIFRWMGYFFVEKILINTCNLQDSFLVGIPPIIVGHRVQDISILGFLETTHATNVTCGFSRPSRLGRLPWGIWPSYLLFVHVISLFTLRSPTVVSPIRPSREPDH